MKKIEPTTPIARLAMFARWAKQAKMCKSYSDFERMCGLSPQYLNNVRFNTIRGNCTADIINKVYKVFPMLNIVWVVTGKGSMFTEAPQQGYREAYEELSKELAKIKKIVNEIKLP